MGNSFEKKEEKTQLSDFDIKTLIEATSFDKNQILDWHDGFLKDSPNGTITKAKFLQTYGFLFPNGKADKFTKQIFKVFDPNNNGVLDFSDFLMSISLTSHGLLEKKLNTAFMIYDLDSNGFISKSEMIKLVKAIFELMDLDGSTSKEQVEEIMSKLDKNQDNFLSKEEFIQGCLNDDFIKNFLIPF